MSDCDQEVAYPFAKGIALTLATAAATTATAEEVFMLQLGALLNATECFTTAWLRLVLNE